MLRYIIALVFSCFYCSVTVADVIQKQSLHSSIIAALNDGLPTMIDEITRLDSIGLSDYGDVVTYNYSLFTTSGSTERPSAEDTTRIVLLQFCDVFGNEPNEISILYVYRDSTDGTVIQTVRVTQADCFK
jgi:hypothetical protein